MFCREFLRYNLIPISNIHSDVLIIWSSKILKRLKSGMNLYFDNLSLEASNNYDYYCSFFSNCKLKFSLEAILEEILLRATNFHSPTSAIDGSREGKDGDRGTDPVNRIVHLKISWKQRLENETGKEGVELFSVFLDPRESLWATSSFWNGGLIHRWHIYSRTNTSKFSLVEIEWCRSEGWDFLFSLTFAYARINDSFFWRIRWNNRIEGKSVFVSGKINFGYINRNILLDVWNYI